MTNTAHASGGYPSIFIFSCAVFRQRKMCVPGKPVKNDRSKKRRSEGFHQINTNPTAFIVRQDPLGSWNKVWGRIRLPEPRVQGVTAEE